MLLACVSLFIAYILSLARFSAALYDFESDFGGVANDDSPLVCARNTRLLNNVFRRNLDQHETLRIVDWNRTMYFHPGIVARNLENVHLLLDGTMRFERPDKNASSQADAYLNHDACWSISDSTNVTFSSSVKMNESLAFEERGVLDGQGSQYWGVPYIGYLQVENRRPALVRVYNSSQVLVQRVILQDCPLECLVLDHVDRVHVRNSTIVSRRTTHRTHGFADLSAFGSKGITINASSHVNVDSVDIWTQDECININDESNNVKLDGVNASGLGFAITSSGGRVHDIAIHNSRLYRSIKGLYLKFYPSQDDASGGGAIEHVQIENVTMESIAQWPLWFGPGQRATEQGACQADPCSLCWPQASTSSCNVIPTTVMRNLTLRNVQINNPKLANGVMLSDPDKKALMDIIIFENVRVTRGEQLAYATKDLTQTFPGLKRPVRDAYVVDERRLLDARSAMDHVEKPEQLDDYHGYILPSQEFLGMNLAARVGIIVGTCLCALSLVLLMALCIRLQCRHDDSFDDDDSVLRPSEESQHELHVSFLDEEWLRHRQRDSGNGVLDDDNASESMIAHDDSRLDEPLLAGTARPPRSTRVSRSCQVAPYHVVALLAAMYGLLIGLSWLVEVPGRPDWENLNRYYMCEGVTNGVARGSTWPVPYCFLNETEWFSWTQAYDHISSFLRSHFVLAACLLTCFSLYIHFSFLFKERTPRNALASIGDNTII
ncbi:hypothetical protein MPSEU_000700700 [Mayamaea pseudoterrestris]|nr:hypothetical protein MPSEU_000700700 [Mayamaea pseudoterrestris]